jgi:hypothetical protein
MEKLDIEKFNPTVMDLTKAVAESKKIIVTDVRDLKQVELARKSKNLLRKMEIKIEKTGKEYRQDARDFINKILEKEKELKSITTPEIERLEKIEDESDATILLDARKLSLPARSERLIAIGADVVEDLLLQMDDIQFEAFCNQKVAEKNETDRLHAENMVKMEREKLLAEQAEKEKKLEAEKLEHLAKMKEENRMLEEKRAEEQAKIDEQNRKIEAEKLEIKHQKELQEAKESAKIQAEQERIRIEKEKMEFEKVGAKKLAKREAYIKFLKDNGYTTKNSDSYYIQKTEGKIVLFKKVGEFIL